MPAPTIEDFRALAQILVALLFGLAVYLAVLPVGQCDQCGHCRTKRIGDAWCPQHGVRKRDCESDHRP